MTRDDSLVQMLLDSGAIDDAEAPFHPHRNIILHSLGGDVDGLVPPHVREALLARYAAARG